MTKPKYENAEFMLSVANLSQLPPDEGIEVAIVGRSNAGKSSVLNQLTRNKGLARVSKTPGRTQQINLFALDKNRRLADLPGYGYAKVPPALKQQWELLMDAYLRNRDSLQGLLVVMDIRHPFKDYDKQLLIWSSQCQIPVHILLNKVDKITPQELKKTLRKASDTVPIYPNLVTFQTFSATKGIGIKELREKLDAWFTI
jgi:GTP-binding protein